MEAIAQETGMSRWWVYKYLAKKYKVQTNPSQSNNGVGYRPIPPYRRITVFIDNNTARLIDDLTSERKFRDSSETVIWLIKEALAMLGKLNSQSGDSAKNTSGEVLK